MKVPKLILGTDLSLSTEAALYFPRHQLDTSDEVGTTFVRR